MNNEIGRKITSLTLMMIMVAGGLTFAVPGAMPAAHAANANLFVSAENSQFDNYMSGPQVIEVVIIDSDINDTDESKGEPDVTVNGKRLRMVQATDGNWYGYFADRTRALIADSTAESANVLGHGLDFGSICSQSSTGFGTNFFSETVGVAIPVAGVGDNGTSTGGGNTTTCNQDFTTLDNTNGTGAGKVMNVLREAKSINPGTSSVDVGQIDVVDADIWPFIQLYNLNPTGNVVVQYNKGGGAQTTTLTFDTVDQFAGLELDRTKYPRNAQVHATVTDLWLNIDPTDEDSWTWGAANGTTVYQLFDENGATAGDGSGVKGIQTLKDDLMCEDNCVLLFDPNAQGTTAVVTIQNNTDVAYGITDADDPETASTKGGTIAAGDLPITLVEQGPNSGIFGTYDEGDLSTLQVISDAARGNSATLDYNETPTTVLIGFEFATIDIQPTDDEWNSGEEIPVVLVDGDANKNSRADEDLDIFNADNDLIPALRTGDPFTVGEVATGSDTSAKAVFINWPTITFGTNNTGVLGAVSGANVTTDKFIVQKFSQRALATVNSTEAENTVNALIIDFNTNGADFKSTVKNNQTGTTGFNGFNLLNIDIRSLTTTGTFDVYLLNTTASDGIISASNDGNVTHGAEIGVLGIANDVEPQSLTLLNKTAIFEIFEGTNLADDDKVGLALVSSDTFSVSETEAFVADFFSFGFTGDGVADSDRVQNQIIRLELEETGDNTSTFEGSLEYTMVNQLNVLDPKTYTGISTIADDPSFIVFEDRTDEDSPRVTYLDLGADGVGTQVSDQQEAPAHSGVVSFDANNYKIADTVTITLEDADLNVDSDLIDIFTVVETAGSDVQDKVGKDGLPNFSFGDLGRLLDIEFDSVDWKTPSSGSDCRKALDKLTTDTGLGATGFTLVETGTETGVFVGDFQIPNAFCRSDSASTESVTGLDMEVNYVDFRDASGEIIEVGDSAGVRANTGSVSLDRTVYPVPFGQPDDFTIETTQRSPDGESIFAIHASGIASDEKVSKAGRHLENGDLVIHVRVNDPDFDISASGEDEIAENTADQNRGPVKISVIRGAKTVNLGYAGGPSVIDGVISVGNNVGKNVDSDSSFRVDGDDSGTAVTTADPKVRQFGPMDEIAPDAGIFEADIVLRYTDGPADANCPDTTEYRALNGSASTDVTSRFSKADPNGFDYCILQGDILQVEYTDPVDASGDPNTVTDSATFDLRNGVLQSDKSVYIIGSDMILTLIEPDLDLDNDQAETWDLDLIEWDSDAATITMGDAGGEEAAFDPEPSDFRETGDSTGIFQIVIEIPEELSDDRLERGEEIVLEYTDWGPSGSDYVGQEDEDVNLTIYTSNFGATVELDQKVYTWTDKVYITIVAPDHNFDSDLVDDIGNTDLDPIKISTRGQSLDRYKLVETGTDTGIFTGEVILTGFSTHDADGDGDTGDATGITGDGSGNKNNIGPTNGFLRTSDDDGITVSFEFSEDETVVGSALIRWNIGEVQWLEASYPASGTGVVRVIDPDMNLDPEAVDNFDVDVWSDSDAGGIDLTVTETNEATGIFEGTVFFTTTDESSGHRLRVAEGDTVTAEYEDNTLPDPYTTADELDITATSLIGTVVPPLERAPAANLRTVDAFGNSLDTVSVDQQVQITADLANGQDREQAFAYLVQIQDASGVTVSLAWITGSLSPGQSFSPALSWIPQEAGSYTATAFVWESVDNPTALSPPVTTTINVQ